MHTSVPALQCCLDSADSIARRQIASAQMLAAIGFDATAVNADFAADMTTLPLTPLAYGYAMPEKMQAMLECWRCDPQDPVIGADQVTVAEGSCRISYRHSDHLLFGMLQIDENQLRAGDNSALQLASEIAYRELFALTARLGFPHILRFWNYLADINRVSDDCERYRQFNIGRQEGFLQAGHGIGGSVPAASAVGTGAGPLTIHFIAARAIAARTIENPRQVSAYDYPADYGPRSPTFSRAALARIGQHDVLFLSGTASIVGHQTLHAGDVVAQSREIVANIEAILAQANNDQAANATAPHFTLRDFCFRVYLRHAADLALIQATLVPLLGAGNQPLFLQADICRSDLLVEIEGVASRPSSVDS